MVPPQSAPKFVRESTLAAANGFLDVDKFTLQHKNYPNIFGLGDVCNLPTGKTASAIFTQTQVVMENLRIAMGSEGAVKHYNGYAACPMFVGDKKLMMIEFAYDNKADPSFYADQTSVARKSFYYIKKELFPFVYWNLMPRGLWKGASSFKRLD